MIDFDQALRIGLDLAFQLPTKHISLGKSHGRVLAEDIISDVDMPPFNKSAVDGFACRSQDIQNELEIIEIIPAGKYPEKQIKKGQCAKIMTGAPVPTGADCVVMVEQSEEFSDNKVRFSISKTSPNIAYQAEDVKVGMKLISSGIIIKPGHIAVMASAGFANLLVSAMPQVGIISTGDELVEPDQKPSSACIRNSNAYQLVAQVQAMGCIANYMGIAKDDENITLAFLEKALAENDVVLITGGVSMGDFDHVPAMMEKAGMEVLFKKIAIQPGRPTVLAKKENKLCFGLPGNPVSSFVLFELLVKPVLYKMMGHVYKPDVVKLPLLHSYKRKKSDRMNVVPVRIVEGESIETIDYHGSAHIHSMVFADGLIFIPVGTLEIAKGSLTYVRQL